jgi:hypothetical protein
MKVRTRMLANEKWVIEIKRFFFFWQAVEVASGSTLGSVQNGVPSIQYLAYHSPGENNYTLCWYDKSKLNEKFLEVQALLGLSH